MSAVADKKIIAIIPARGGSKGLPDKNIYPIAGRPLIAWTIEQSVNTKSVHATFVSTNNAEIAHVSEAWGAETIWRPNDLSTDTATSESAILHAVKFLRQERGIKPDIIVFLQATSPLRKRDDIENAIEIFHATGADSLISGSYVDDFLIWQKRQDGWHSFNYDYKNRGCRQDRKPQFVENGSIYIFKSDVIERFNNRIGGKLEFYEMDFWQTWEIDTGEQVDLVEFYLNSKLKQTNFAKLRESRIELMAFDFDGVFTDNKVLTLENGLEAVVANRSDGLAISELKRLDIPLVIISTERNPVVKARAEKLKIDVFQDVTNKRDILVNYCNQNAINLGNVIYVGNDVNDKPVMEVVGWPICPGDANDIIKNISRVVLTKSGGDGVIRELSEIFIN